MDQGQCRQEKAGRENGGGGSGLGSLEGRCSVQLSYAPSIYAPSFNALYWFKSNRRKVAWAMAHLRLYEMQRLQGTKAPSSLREIETSPSLLMQGRGVPGVVGVA